MTRIKQAFYPLCIALAVGCGGGSNTTTDAGVTHDLSPAGPDMTVPMVMPVACDPIAQTGCTDKSMPKCTAVVDNNMNDDLYQFIIAGCMPQQNPQVGDEMTCVRSNMQEVGNDNCMPGEYCSGYGPLAAGKVPTRRCHKFCTDDTQCTSMQKCANLIDKEVLDMNNQPTLAPQAGFCVAACTILGTDCGAGYDCSTLLLDFDFKNVAPSCRQLGQTAIGGTCADDTECVAGSICIDPDPNAQTPAPKCTQLCDASHACPSGKTCSIPQDMNGIGILPTMPNMGGICH